MSRDAILVEQLSKQYAVGAAQQGPGTFYDLLTNALRFGREARGTRRTAPSTFWALRDLSFKIAQGEVFGIVGRNGAGKSTLLKILSRITAPTQGRVTVHGRVASLLEVGTGFHPELTGRENIYLNATILGMRRSEIDRKLDAIVAFSGVEKFLDTPVKRYSSGMYVRLAFAVAAHVDADILLIDEVLAVGDAEFQKRCLGVMGDVARGGRTVLFVSHNLTALRNLCTSGLLLREGTVEFQGPIDEVLNRYEGGHGSHGKWAVELADGGADKAAWLRRVSIALLDDQEDADLTVASRFAIEVDVQAQADELDLGVYLHCQDAAGNRVFSHGSFFQPALNGSRVSRGTHRFTCELPGYLLNAGEYGLDVFLIKDRTDVIDSHPSVLSLRIHDLPTGIEGWNWPIVGVIRPRLEWSRAAAPA